MNEGERGPKPRRPLTDAETQMLLDAKRSAEQVLKPLAESLNSKTFQNLVANAQTYENLLAGLKASLPRMDEVIRLAGVSSTDLRSLMPTQTEALLPNLPINLKSGTEYAIERVERELGQLAAIGAAMAENTRANAEIQKASLTQTETLLVVMQQLHATTIRGIASSERASNTLIVATGMMVVPTLLILFLTAILVLHGG